LRKPNIRWSNEDVSGCAAPWETLIPLDMMLTQHRVGKFKAFTFLKKRNLRGV
jgi:hypothetical protein